MLTDLSPAAGFKRCFAVNPGKILWISYASWSTVQAGEWSRTRMNFPRGLRNLISNSCRDAHGDQWLPRMFVCLPCSRLIQHLHLVDKFGYADRLSKIIHLDGWLPLPHHWSHNWFWSSQASRFTFTSSVCDYPIPRIWENEQVSQVSPSQTPCS